MTKHSYDKEFKEQAVDLSQVFRHDYVEFLTD